MRFSRNFLFALWVTGVSLSASSATYTNLVVFGDSLSDPGNAMLLTGGVPGPKLDAQGHFSNGKTSAEYLADALGVTTTLGWSAGGGNNYAVGGAMAGTGNIDQSSIPSLAHTGVASQIAKYNGSGNSATTLFMVQGGANDLFQGFNYVNTTSLTNGEKAAYFTTLIDSVSTTMATNVASLAAKGATHILWTSLPDLGLTPMAAAAGTVDPSFASLATGVSTAFNQALAYKIGLVDAGLGANVDIVGVDTASFVQSQKAHGTLNMTTPCLAAGTAPGCAGLFFWDEVHPTTAAHQLFAQSLIAAVPEPETWAMFIMGLGLLGVAARRRPRQI